ncbi:hypothetical protein ACIPPM_25125 [Streptomyces sp. NPDC090119]|uniref:hypothetical protein n=1 Tax=Streptomyces sp. NPDC090119 TaxID=3365951 RepID=UPI003819E5A0
MSTCSAVMRGEDREVLRELLSMGMVNADDSAPEKLTAVDPRVVEARAGAQLRSSALMLLEDARSPTELLRPLIAESRPVSGVGHRCCTPLARLATSRPPVGHQEDSGADAPAGSR